jgi:hypothetical protein
VGPRAGLDTEVRGKISCLCRGSNLDRPVVESVARSILTELPRLHNGYICVCEKFKFALFIDCRPNDKYDSSVAFDSIVASVIPLVAVLT